MPPLNIRLNLPGFSSPEPFRLASAPATMRGLACVVLEEIGGFSKEELQGVRDNLDKVPLTLLGELCAGQLVELGSDAQLGVFLATAESPTAPATIEVRPKGAQAPPPPDGSPAKQSSQVAAVTEAAGLPSTSNDAAGHRRASNSGAPSSSGPAPGSGAGVDFVEHPQATGQNSQGLDISMGKQPARPKGSREVLTADPSPRSDASLATSNNNGAAPHPQQQQQQQLREPLQQQQLPPQQLPPPPMSTEPKDSYSSPMPPPIPQDQNVARGGAGGGGSTGYNLRSQTPEARPKSAGWAGDRGLTAPSSAASIEEVPDSYRSSAAASSRHAREPPGPGGGGATGSRYPQRDQGLTATPVHIRLYQEKDERRKRLEEARIRRLEQEEEDIRCSAQRALGRAASPNRLMGSPEVHGHNRLTAATPPRIRPPLPERSSSLTSLQTTTARRGQLPTTPGNGRGFSGQGQRPRIQRPSTGGGGRTLNSSHHDAGGPALPATEPLQQWSSSSHHDGSSFMNGDGRPQGLQQHRLSATPGSTTGSNAAGSTAGNSSTGRRSRSASPWKAEDSQQQMQQQAQQQQQHHQQRQQQLQPQQQQQQLPLQQRGQRQEVDQTACSARTSSPVRWQSAGFEASSVGSDLGGGGHHPASESMLIKEGGLPPDSPDLHDLSTQDEDGLRRIIQSQQNRIEFLERRHHQALELLRESRSDRLAAQQQYLQQVKLYDSQTDKLMRFEQLITEMQAVRFDLDPELQGRWKEWMRRSRAI
eukprot:CAMPEP_0206588304 /NCGR_PEP_ID=MMETSP0325_2-20121206/38194_1 /ASSEMBLY_ACC=CAM_ASM_000347 /TAXON_ID=2866 /ORGANISM="Crypthecodinium cohnii, Strain Seligo" /LENGTH=759 /DNA_ID=CAMNT_0054096539 /DNA_START=177 /DNA_END=2453 /DNA_ORIENTATION=+